MIREVLSLSRLLVVREEPVREREAGLVVTL